jgi:type VI secretion system protein ImpJ
VNEVVERCCAASRTLGQFRRERGPEAIGYGVGDFEQLLGRQMINQYVPELQHALVNESIHPFPLYGLLVGLRGALTSYWPDEEAWTFPAYDHTDLAACFGAVCESIGRLLERLLPVRYREIPLERSNFEFTAALDEVVLARGTYWVLALHGNVPEDELRRRIETQAKVSSASDMRQLVNIAVRGVTLRHLPVPPAEMPRYAGWYYFQVDTADRGFAKIKDTASFAFYLPDAEADLEARLMVVLAEERAGGR